MTPVLVSGLFRIKPKLFRVVTENTDIIRRIRSKDQCAREECILALVAHSSWFVVGEGVLPAVGAGAAPRPPAKDKLEQRGYCSSVAAFHVDRPRIDLVVCANMALNMANALCDSSKLKVLLLKQGWGFQRSVKSWNLRRIGWNVANVEPDGQCMHSWSMTLNALLRGNMHCFTTVSRLLYVFITKAEFTSSSQNTFYGNFSTEW
jgi:hypothetical protein